MTWMTPPAQSADAIATALTPQRTTWAWRCRRAMTVFNVARSVLVLPLTGSLGAATWQFVGAWPTWGRAAAMAGLVVVLAAAAWRSFRRGRARQHQLFEALDALAGGRLAVRLAPGPNFADAVGQAWVARFNRMAEALDVRVQEVLRASSVVQQAGDEMSMAAQTLAIRTEDQSEVINQTNTAIDDVLASVRCTSDMATHVDELSRQLCHQADRSEQVVQAAAAAVERISRSTAEMTQHLHVIDAITFQTRILALNAAIEAARAGQAGRGFAVVANEVRALAGRTAEASQQIKRMIDRSNGEVVQGVQEIGAVKEAVTRIGQGFREVSAQMRDVSGSNLAQSAAIGLISQGLDQLLCLTQANTQLVVSSVGASEQLRGGAGDLRLAIHRLSEDQPPADLTAAGADSAAPTETCGVEFF